VGGTANERCRACKVASCFDWHAGFGKVKAVSFHDPSYIGPIVDEKDGDGVAQ
jgi:hypothetical protein